MEALGGLFNAKVYRKKAKFSKELTFEKYANISLCAGLFEEKPVDKTISENETNLSPEEEKKILEEQMALNDELSKNIQDIIIKDENEEKNKLKIEKIEEQFLEKELSKHKNCKQLISVDILYLKHSKTFPILRVLWEFWLGYSFHLPSLLMQL